MTEARFFSSLLEICAGICLGNAATAVVAFGIGIGYNSNLH